MRAIGSISLQGWKAVRSARSAPGAPSRPGARRPADVPSVLPEGDPVPPDGSLPPGALEGLGQRPFGVYVHVPFCATRCGYCDFNTYTASELGGGASRDTYPGQAAAEIQFARHVLGQAGTAAEVPVQTVFFGGGTPTLLPPGQLGGLLRVIDGEFGLVPGAEVTVEANPETITPPVLAQLRAEGITRISFGMQSAQPHVLAVLDRVHQPGRPAQCARWAREAGFEHVSLDLIYGTPGETDSDWRRSLEAALAAGPDHISAYALIVEDGTRLAARVRRGELPAPDDDAMADRYLIADELLSGHGLDWYEVSNWAASPAARCAHNLLYWTGADWWGVGPGAHSHVGGTRWWNVKHPAAYAGRITAGVSPGYARETLTPAEHQLEQVMLLTRLADGCPMTELDPAGRDAAEKAVADGLADAGALAAGRVVLTLRGRLLADAVIRDLTV
jgi:putative oxygen-independent coproporphyrinogen III oxidase